MLHTILGAGGAISQELVPRLVQSKFPVRLVSRNPVAESGCESIAADLLDANAVIEAVKGSSVVYLLAGLVYDVRVWRVQWPRIMKNVIDACKESSASLIFFDNVYMYGRVDGMMNEQTPFNPCSEKGEVRARVAQMLLDEIAADNIRALIARSADFYTASSHKASVPNLLVFDRLQQGKTAQWIANADVLHSLTFVPDAAEALTLLATRDDAFNQTWHLPTADNPLTGRQLAEAAAVQLKVEAKLTVLRPWMISMAGIFNRTIKESKEMMYQSEYPYLFDSTKFNRAFSYNPTSYADGIKIACGNRPISVSS